MKKLYTLALPALLAGAVLAAVAAGCAPKTDEHVHMPGAAEQTPAAGQHDPRDHDAAEKSMEEFIAIQDGRFEPADMVIQPGYTVTWINHDSKVHQIHADDEAFESPELEPHQSYSTKFTASGRFSYHDHLNGEIKGTIVVE